MNPLASLLAGQDWARDAACARHPHPQWWDADQRDPNLVRRARDICLACPVRVACGESASPAEAVDTMRAGEVRAVCEVCGDVLVIGQTRYCATHSPVKRGDGTVQTDCGVCHGPLPAQRVRYCGDVCRSTAKRLQDAKRHRRSARERKADAAAVAS